MLKISVIVPIYNLEDVLKYTIPSILNQTYENIQIILVNDGSTDNSLKICKEFEKIDSRIEIINQANQGQSAARNSGIKIATGDFYSFIDGDDMIHPQMYEIMLSNITMPCNSIIACKTIEIDSLEKVTFEEVKDINNINKYFYSKPEFVNLLGKQYRSRFEMWDKLIPVNSMVDIYFPTGIVHEEVAVIHKIIKNIEGYIFIDFPLHRYLVSREGNTKSKPFTETRLSVHKTFKVWLNELKTNNIENYRNILQFCLNFSYGQLILAVNKKTRREILEELFDIYDYYLLEADSVTFKFKLRDRIIKQPLFRNKKLLIKLIKLRNFFFEKLGRN